MLRSLLSGRRAITLLAIASLLLLPACGSASKTADQPKEKVRIGYLEVMDDAQVMVAKDAGFFDKHGLDAELQLFGSGTDLIKAIVGGQLQAGVLGFTNAVSWKAQGADVKVVGGAQMGYHSLLVGKDPETLPAIITGAQIAFGNAWRSLIVTPDLPQPRQRSSAGFAALRQTVLQQLGLAG